MKIQKAICFFLLGVFVAAIVGCDSKQVVTADQKTGSTKEARKDKKGLN